MGAPLGVLSTTKVIRPPITRQPGAAPMVGFPQAPKDTAILSPEATRRDPLAAEKEAIAKIDPSKVVTKNIVAELQKVVHAYEQAQLQGDTVFAKKCKLLAVRLVRVAEKEKQANPCRPLVKSLGIYIPTRRTRAQKALHIAALFFTAPDHTFNKTTANIGSGEHDPKYLGNLDFLPGQKGRGYEATRIYARFGDDTSKIGTVVTIPVSAPVKLHYIVGRTTQEHEVRQGTVAFSSAAYMMNTTTVAALSIRHGTPDNLRFNPEQHGLVVIENGCPKIINLKTMGEEGAMARIDDALASKGTLFQSNLLVYNGKNIVPREGSEPKRDVRRALATFKDGSYGFINISEFVDIYELGAILSKVPNIVSAVNLDTGDRNVGGYGGESFGFTAGKNASNLLVVR